MVKEQLIKNSALVVAHPDDEILWFPSSLEKIGRIIFCYIECPSNTQWNTGRRQVIAEYPFSNLISLDLAESGVFNKMDWYKPETGIFGVKFKGNSQAIQRYEKNFYQLRNVLAQNLRGFKQVITHNPWGEYGNEEHIQVYRAVKTLQSELGFDIWFSNHLSNKSLNLFSRYFEHLDTRVLKSPINQNLIRSIKAIYERNKCWTWYENWEWGNEEILIRERSEDSERDMFGYSIPVNLIKTTYQQAKKKQKNDFRQLVNIYEKLNSFNRWSRKRHA
jgi:hypothetical protein